MVSNDDSVRAITAAQCMADWMLAAGADEEGVQESLDSIEKPLRAIQKEVNHG